MPAQVRALLERILAWWNRFTTRQKTFIITGVVAVVLTAALLAAILTRPNYVHLYTATTATESKQVDDILTDAGLDYTVSSDGMTFQINAKQESRANIALNGNNIRSATWSITDVTTGSFSTTESDKNRLWVDYLEKKISGDFIEAFDAVNWARVQLNIPDNDGTLLAKTQESGAAITLELNNPEEFTEDNAAYMARAIATALGNATTDNIVIMDTKANLLFAGGSESGSMGSSTSQFTYKAKAEQEAKAKARAIVLGTSLFSKADVAVNLNIDFSNSRNTTHEYYAPEGQTQGVLAHEDYYTADNTAGVSGIPGTDSNDEATTYVLQDNQNSSSSVEEYSRDYLPHESITESTSWGKIDYTGSTISVTATHYNVVNESDYKASEHDGVKWEAYKLANSLPLAQASDGEVFNQVRQLVSNATGIPVENVTLALYDEYFFVDKSGRTTEEQITDILQIVLIIAILLLLAFVILRSMRTAKEEVEEGPAELSVESLLESQPLDSELDNIEMDAGSETRRLIEKFIDENPEAAASLLRNWLNEGVF